MLLLLGLLAGVWSDAAAQRTGTIAGRVVAAPNPTPLATVQVYIVGTGLGTLTGRDGRFVIPNIPAGTHQLRAERIGYEAVTKPVTVVAGQSLAVNFELKEAVLGLDEIVVTGEAGAARRREIGNTVSQIKVADMSQVASVGVEGLLQGRAASLTISESSGSSGSGSTIRLRGINSVAMSNAPLVYVDGVRIRSEPYPRNYPPADITNRSSNVFASPVNNIDPASIERIEIIKGAAATALYGTEASSGVIQIFTKRGAPGKARWELQVEQGFAHLLPLASGTSEPYMQIDPWLRGAPSFLAGGIRDRVEGRFAAGDFCTPAADPRYCDWQYEVAYRQKYYVSARGGASDLSYFVGGSWEKNKGILPNDSEEKFNIRGNFGFNLMENLQLQWNTSLTRNHTSNTPSGNNSHGIILNTYRKNTSYVGGYKYDLVQRIMDYQIDNSIDNLITGATASYSPSPKFNSRLTVGWDRSAVEPRQVRPFGFILAPRGILGEQKWVAEILTFDYAGSYILDFGERFGLTASFGGQATESETTAVLGHAENFPGPGEPTLSSGGSSLSFEDRVRVVTGGFFGQARLDWRDRVFVTAGLRTDGNSAFGQDLGLEMYPKLSVSWVISDESFWRPALGSLKLRGAIGEAGRAPGAFDAVRTWDPTKFGSSPGFLPRNLGNPNLGPERTREHEVGLDASVLDNRLTAEFTFYYQKVRDALFGVRSTPSSGGWGAQLENVGVVVNRGLELNLNGTVIERERLGLDMGLTVSTNSNKVIDLGGAAPFTVGGSTWVIEGEAVPALRGYYPLNPDEIADPVYETCFEPGTQKETNRCVVGPNQPTRTIGGNAELRLPGNITLSARGEYLGGFYMPNSAQYAGVSRGAEWATCGDMSARIAKGDKAGIPARFRDRCDWRSTRLNGSHVYKADFFKLRDLSAQFPLSRFVRWGENPTLTLSARNWFRWYNEDWKLGGGLDPEMSTNSGYNAVFRDAGEHVPPPAVFTMSMRVGF